MIHGYMVFHLNLAFSSIPVSARSEVIQKCYWPLLELADKTSIPIGIELTGWTLQKINEIDSAWVERFKLMLENNSCELIGSGWTQLIGPLVPYEVNLWNQKLGLEFYQKILDIKPTLALVNEMAFSTGMVNVYKDSGYQGIIMEQDNIRLALSLDEDLEQPLSNLAKGIGDSSIRILWTDSILFQKFQRVAHGEQTVNEYLNFLSTRCDKHGMPIAIYSNDVEVFNYRPGRFKTETDVSSIDEWQRIIQLCEELTNKEKVKWLKPSEALDFSIKRNKAKEEHFTKLSYPIPVKKQSKYNISRWAISGRNDLWINTVCFRIFSYLSKNNIKDERRWKILCEFWASDFRTHITEDRWLDTTTQIEQQLDEFNINSEYVSKYNLKNKPTQNKEENKNCFISKIDPDNGILNIESESVKLVLNLRKGLTIDSLSFKEHDFEPCVVTVPHGYFNSIKLSADFYSAGLVLELPTEHRRATDLSLVKPIVSYKDDCVMISAEIKTEYGDLLKTYTINQKTESVQIRFDFDSWNKPYGVLRISALTLNPNVDQSNVYCLFKSGGSDYEKLKFDDDFNHAKSASTLVTATTGLGATDGSIIIKYEGKQCCVEWDQETSAVFPILQYEKSKPGSLLRLFLSMGEMDETLRNGGNIPPISFSISPFIDEDLSING